MYKTLEDKRLEMKFHFMFKCGGSFASEAALKQLTPAFNKYGTATLWKGILIFRSQRTFLDKENCHEDAHFFARQLENEILSEVKKIVEFDMLYFD